MDREMFYHLLGGYTPNRFLKVGTEDDDTAIPEKNILIGYFNEKQREFWFGKPWDSKYEYVKAVANHYQGIVMLINHEWYDSEKIKDAISKSKNLDSVLQEVGFIKHPHPYYQK